jgi:hypothetical protein
MLWIDSDQYYGPDRRRLREKRLRERRRLQYDSRLPAMNTALTQLRMRTLDAQGARLAPFILRLKGAVALANIKNEAGVSRELVILITHLNSHREGDVRPVIYAALDRAQAAQNDLYAR